MPIMYRYGSVAFFATTASFALAITTPDAAQAQQRFLVRGAVLQHDILHAGTKESGLDIEFQTLSPVVPRLKILGSPRVYASIAVNSDGDTDLGAVGLAWSWAISQEFTAELEFGYALHDGVLDSDDPTVIETRQLLGSRDLFRTGLAVDRKLNDRWAVGVEWTHFSHGQILGQGRNQGLDATGLRLTRAF